MNCSFEIYKGDIAALTAWYNGFLCATGLPLMSADELAAEIGPTHEHYKIVRSFSDHWERYVS